MRHSRWIEMESCTATASVGVVRADAMGCRAEAMLDAAGEAGRAEPVGERQAGRRGDAKISEHVRGVDADGTGDCDVAPGVGPPARGPLDPTDAASAAAGAE